MARNAVIDTSALYVKRHGFTDFSTDGSFDGATETQEAISDGTQPVPGIPLYHNKIVGQAFVEMTAGEKTAVDIERGAQTVLAEAVYLQMFESNALQSTDLETLQTAMTRTVQPLAAGAYRVQWAFEIQLNPTGPINSRGLFQVSVDGSGVALCHTASDAWQMCSGWDRVAVAEAAQPVLAIEYRRDPVVAGNDAVEIRRMKLSIEKLRKGA